MTRKRITAYVDQDVIKWLDSQVAAGRFRSRSHGVEESLNKLKLEMEGTALGK